MIEREILQTLQQATITAVAMSIMPALPIMYTDITFEIPNDQKYLEIVHIPNNGDDAFWGDEQNYQGIYRLLLHWPIDGAGAYPPLDVAASIAGYFTKTLWLGKVKISGVPKLTGLIASPPENLYPISVRYSAFST